MYIADLHIHSRYSRATSRDCTPENLDLWARRKGIDVVGTGDFTHPGWRKELAEKLEPAEDGLYVLKKEYRIEDKGAISDRIPRFVITGEISLIYKKYDRVRKVHCLILLPSLDAATEMSQKLETIGNIHSDGRPILGMDCHDLLELQLEICPEGIFVPAHIWTPHFSLFGAFSGFSSVEECFGDLSSHIHALETGLSSDPPMNWQVSALDRFWLISNSDAHSPAKLGREANLLDGELSYAGLQRAIQTGKGLSGTIEFFPEEGKYHYDGHRKCDICLTPAETQKYGGICPVCGKKLTIGVSHRIKQLADRQEGYQKAGALPFESLVPLPEVVAASTGHSAGSAKVQRQYMDMLYKLGPEFEILRNLPIEEIKAVSGHFIAEGIHRLRKGKVTRIPGFDGEYGIIRLFAPEELESMKGQISLFDPIFNLSGPDIPPLAAGSSIAGDDAIHGVEDGALSGAREDLAHGIGDGGRAEGLAGQEPAEGIPAGKTDPLLLQTGSHKTAQGLGLNEMQLRAARAVGRVTAVVAGPGSGKTRTLIQHIIYLLETRKIEPSQITAVTFTNQAAGEIRERIQKQLGSLADGRKAVRKGAGGRKKDIKGLQIGTFHSIAIEYLKDNGMEFSSIMGGAAEHTQVCLASEAEAGDIAEGIIEGLGLDMKIRKFLQTVSEHKTGLKAADESFLPALEAYQKELRDRNALDFDDLLVKALQIATGDEVCKGDKDAGAFSYLLVDEFQDISPLQYQLVKAWNKNGKELFVIGDPDQAIYGFRGADGRCFERITQEYPMREEIVLDLNYRSTPQILWLAQEVISHNPGSRRTLHPFLQDGVSVRLIKAESEMAEAIFVAKEIGRLAGGIGMLEAQEELLKESRQVRSFDDIAVLYRTHRQAQLLESCLKKEGIPYVTAGRDDLLMEPDVRGTVCFFKSLQEGEGGLAGRQARKFLLGLKRADKAGGNEGGKEPEGLAYEELAQKYLPFLKKKKPRGILDEWIEELHMEESDAMRKLCGIAVFYRTMEEFLRALALGVESDIKRVNGKRYTACAVTLMTLHGSKGLEFPTVILYGARKGLVPLELGSRPAAIEEERRLFYVGLTRAKEELVITSSGEESCFLEELPEGLLVEERAGRKRNEGEAQQMSLFDHFHIR